MPTMNESSNRYLIDEFPLILLPSLVMVLDKNPHLAMLLQQAHFWIGIAKRSEGKSGKFDKSRWWIYNSIAAWHRQFPFLDERTIRRHLKRLTTLGVLIKEEEVNLKVKGGSRTWFSIDYNRLDELVAGYRQNAHTSADEGYGQIADSEYGQDTHPFTYALDPDSQDLQNQQSAFAAPSAVKPGSPAALVGGSMVTDSPSQGNSKDQNRVKSDERKGTRIPLDELSPLGKYLLTLSSKGTKLSGPIHLTGKQADNLSAEYTVPYKGANRQITPDDLYLSDPLYKKWIETEVYALLRSQGGDKPIARGKLVKAITMGSPILNLSKFLEWREQFVAHEQLLAAINDPSNVGAGAYSILGEDFTFPMSDEDLKALEEGDETT